MKTSDKEKHPPDKRQKPPVAKKSPPSPTEIPKKSGPPIDIGPGPGGNDIVPA